MGYSCNCDMCGQSINVDNSEVMTCYPIGEGPPPFKITFPKWADENYRPQRPFGPYEYSYQGLPMPPQSDCLCTECTVWLKKVFDFAKKHGKRYVKCTAPEDIKKEGRPV